MSDYTVPNPDYPTGLIDRLKPMISDRIFNAITNADSVFDPDHIPKLHEILNESRIPRPMRFCPKEVLSLTLYEEPVEHSADNQDALSMDEYYISQSFCSLCLYICDQKTDVLPKLVSSIYSMDHSLLDELDPLLDWGIQQLDLSKIYPKEQYKLVSIWITKLIADCMRGVQTESTHELIYNIHQIKELIVEIEFSHYDCHIEPADPWIYRSVIFLSPARERWVALAQRWLTNPPNSWNESLRNQCFDIGTMMLPTS